MYRMRYISAAVVSVRPLGSAGGIWTAYKGEGAAFVLLGGLDGSDTNVIVWNCEDSRGKTWALDRSLSSGSYFQIRYTGPVAAGQPKHLCVAGQQPGGSGTVRKIKSRVVES